MLLQNPLFSSLISIFLWYSVVPLLSISKTLLHPTKLLLPFSHHSLPVSFWYNVSHSGLASIYFFSISLGIFRTQQYPEIAVYESRISEISFRSSAFHQIVPCFFLSISLFHTSTFSSNTAFSILIPCQSHLDSFLSLSRPIPDKSNNHPSSSFSSALKKSSCFLFPSSIVLWGPVSPEHLLRVSSLLHCFLWCVILSLSLSFTGYSPSCNPLHHWTPHSAMYF